MCCKNALRDKIAIMFYCTYMVISILLYHNTKGLLNSSLLFSVDIIFIKTFKKLYEIKFTGVIPVHPQGGV